MISSAAALTNMPGPGSRVNRRQQQYETYPNRMKVGCLVVLALRFHRHGRTDVARHGHALLAAALVGALTLLRLVLPWKRADGGLRLSVVASDAIVMAVLAMVAPLGWGHTYMLALPLVILRLALIGQTDPLRAFVVFCCVAALMVPAGRLFSFANHWSGWLQNLVCSRYLLATAILAVLRVGAEGERRRGEERRAA